MFAINWSSLLYYISSIADISILAVLIYYILIFFSRKSLLRAFIVFVSIILIYTLSIAANLFLVHWLLDRLFLILPFAIIVIFQQEIKKFLIISFGQTFFSRLISKNEITDEHYQRIVNALSALSKNRTGALIIFARSSSLEFFKMNAVKLSAQITTELLVTIFTPPTPLHDGAIIIEDNLIASAGVFVPITEKNTMLHLGSRHRAAIGISEATDAIVVTVSEETGAISLCIAGEIYYDLDLKDIGSQLIEYVGVKREGQ
jgi:diadenylate cyclase